jgi:putative sugar O-methyltransferase
LNKSYLDVREYVQRIRKSESYLSDYWQEESKSMEYMYNATPEILANLRDHCHWISGVRSYEYKNHHTHDRKRFEIKYKQLKHLAPNLTPVLEPKVMGGFGFEIDDYLVNVDSLKFYESAIALELSGILSYLKRCNRPIIVEIGAGWGGFAAVLKKIIPHCQYIVIDIPATLLFSGTYLGQIFPESSKKFIENLTLDPKEDLVFCAHSELDKLRITEVDLVINMVSFQEMTGSQIEEYANWAQRSKTKYLYSHNREKSKHNHQVESIYAHLKILGEKKLINVLPVDYTIIDGQEFDTKSHILDKGEKVKSDRFNKCKQFMTIKSKILLNQVKKSKTLRQVVGKVLDLFDVNLVAKKQVKFSNNPKLGYQHFYYEREH